MEIGSRIIKIRELLGYTQRQMAEAFNVTPGAIAHWESGHREVPGPVILLVEMYEEELGIVPVRASTKEIDISADRLTQSVKLTGNLFLMWLGYIFKSRFTSIENQNDLRKKVYLAAAEKIQEDFGNLKALPLKIGQLMSYLDFSMPSEARQVLSQLQAKSKPVSYSSIESVFVSSLNRAPEQVFTKWIKRPFSVGSIGQVHWGTTKEGEKVAVKIQFPNIENAIQSDLKTLEKFKNFTRYFVEEKEPGGIFEEVRRNLVEECNYLKEGESQKRFRELFADNPRIRVPKVYPQYSTKQVLCTEFMPDLNYQEFLRSGTEEQKQRAAESIWRFMFECVIKHGVINTDPHPGNYLFGDDHVTFLDFGSVKELDPKFISVWKDIQIKVFTKQSEKEILQSMVEIGVVENLNEIDTKGLFHLTQVIYEPWIEDRVYTFNESYVKNTFAGWFKSNPNLKKMKFHRDWFYLMRSIFGTTAILADLKGTANWHRKALEVLGIEVPTALPSGKNP